MMKEKTGSHGRVHRLFGRLRGWWANPSIMRAFFGYAAVWLVVASICAVALVGVLNEVYRHLMRAQVDELIEVDGGPYIYDAASDELLPATQMYLRDGSDNVVFVGFTDGRDRDSSVDTIVADGWNAGAPVVSATTEMLRENPALVISDWDGNYTEEDYAEADGNPYDEDARIDIDDLAAYDARERACRAPTDELFDGGALGPGVVVSNVGYYVSYDSSALLTPGIAAVRGVEFLAPFACYGVLAIVLFRRFYRRHIGQPLTSLEAAAERIAAHDLDGSVKRVEGRELGKLSETMEEMRASLLTAQRTLWRTAEDRRRLNAAFAHDLRTPITVMRGTVELMGMRARGADDEAVEVPRETIDTLTNQVDRLERYALSMSRVTKLEDRAVERAPHQAQAVYGLLADQAREVVASCAGERALQCTVRGADEIAAVGGSRLVALDVQLVEEVLGNLLSNACAHARAGVAVEVAFDGGARRDGAGARAAAGGRVENGSEAATADTDATTALVLTLVVTDDGPGFTAEALSRGCDPYYSEGKSAEHFGLGLNIARTFARLHGGTLELGNLDGGGACVTATFDVTPHAGSASADDAGQGEYAAAREVDDERAEP